MPEELCIVSDLEKALDYSDDYIFNIHNYQSIQNALEADNDIRVPVVEKLLSFSVRQLKEDLKYTSNILNIISTVLEKIKKAQFSPLPDLVPSAVGVLHTLKTTALFNKVEALKAICFEIILSYPDETLISLVVNQSNELMELINLYCHQRIPLKIRLQVISIVFNLLKILPPEKRATFVKEGIDVWFSKIIPFITITSALPQVLELVELLTQDLVTFEYGDNTHWRGILENIYTPQKYPAFMKNLLESQDENWYRLWIIFIKLLKSQITKSISNTGSPINSMLPVVEMAFKMDVPNRCKAFLCWNVLIDNFSTETNETYINKRIKLLVIPLTSNNAKVEETALAKLNTWWHLICSFYLHMDKISNVVLMPFLYFCFGKFVSEKPMFIPGMISDSTKAQCVQAFINISGHDNCEGCVNLPKLKGKLLTPKILVDHWREWIYYLNIALKTCAENDQFTNKQIQCLWKSFIKTITELPDNNIRRDLFMEILGVLDKITTDHNSRFYDIILNILIYSLIEDVELQPLMITKDDKYCPITYIVKIVVLKFPVDIVESSQAVNNLKPLGNFLIKEAFNTTSHTMECILRDLSSNEICLWVAFADSVCENYYNLCERLLCKMILWPLKFLEQFAKEDLATTAWLKLYEFAYNKLQKTKINENVFTILMSHTGNLKSRKFIINASIAAAQKKVDCTDEDFENEVEWLLKSISTVNVHEDIQDMIPVLSSILVNMMKKLCVNKNFNVAEQVILVTEQMFKQYGTKNTLQDSSVHLKIILENLKTFLNITEYSKLLRLLLNEFKSFASIAKNSESLRDVILDILNVGIKDASVEEIIKLLKENPEAPKQTEEAKFTTPGTKSSAKKPRKKETNIVNTVIEDGEEYIVVKSNWKFNPRKLTDNQKEKFQRKREDIPALYQDLSQSQDDFKLNTWKSDSQDTTTTSKSTSTITTGNEDVTTILKNIPHSEFVPKILENIIGKEKGDDSKEISFKENTNIESKMDSKIDANKLQIVKESKSPRVALKDRVFKNVKSLMEKSNVNNENSVTSSKVSDNLAKTPTTTKSAPFSHVTNSAPTLISADRPSRLKRKPKKFEDLQVFGLKRRRHSLGQNDSPTDGESSDGSSVEPNSLESKRVIAVSETKQTDEANEEKEYTAKVTIPDSNETCLETSENEQQNDIHPIEKPKNNEKVIEVDTSAPKSMATDVIYSNETQIDELTETIQKPAEGLITKPSEKNDKNLSTPKADQNKMSEPKSSTKKASLKKSRIEKELAIDMVEGHPFLNTSQSEKRLTRKAILNSPCTRKHLTEKTNRNKVVSPKTDKKVNDKDKPISIKDTQNSTVDILESQDIIESSQESSITTISVKSNKTPRKVAIVSLEDINKKNQDTQSLKDAAAADVTINSKDDVELPENRTVEEKLLIDLTENMDTEPMTDNFDIIVINDEDDQLVNDNKDESVKNIDMHNTAEADTQTLDSQILRKESECENMQVIDITTSIPTNADISNIVDKDTIADDATETMSESILDKDSPFKDEEQRKMDFMNNTLEISPIKTMSPLQERKSPPESSDYMVIKLSSPVQGNGEPIDKCESPEIFTEEKSSPRDQSSPVREETTAFNTSPSSAFSLKKNRPQVRSNGRAAQMLGLCVPDIRMDEEKKSPSVNTSARRNLRILYNANSEPNDNVEEKEDSGNFLKFKKLLPSTDCSPSGPILKRKLAEITDEATTSPASKRKRVSFHDPPVSTTICVKKYIEPCGLRSPQNSAIKRQERLLRSQLPMKSPKRLENVFKLDSILTKTVESFSENTISDTETSPPETIPVAEVDKTSELNDVDPICPELIECKDSIANIATDLSSPAMKVLLVKEFEGKIETIGDLAKLPELEINKLCIGTPRVQTAKKVLNEYLNKMKLQDKDTEETIVKETETSENKSVEVQTNILVENTAMQTDELVIQTNTTQTELPLAVNCSVQADEAERSTADIVTTCLSERADFLEQLCDKMDEDSKRKIADNLSFNDLSDSLISKLTSSNSTQIINRVIEEQSKTNTTDEINNDRKLCFIKDYLCDNFEPKDLVLFCSDLLKKVYNNL